METQKHELVISYRSVDDERVSSFKDKIEETLKKNVCAKLASDTIIKEEHYSDALASCKVFILVCSSSYAQIGTIERKRIENGLKYLSAQEDKRIVFVTLDSPEVPGWMEEILPRQQVTALSNQNSLEVFYETLRNKILNSNLDKIKALPKGVFKVGNLYYRAVRDGNVVEIAPEFGDKLPEERFIRYFGDKGDLTELVIPDKISYGGHEYNVVGIGKNAFYDSYGYQTVVIPETVEYIGEWAFCDSNLEKLEMPDSITEIKRGAFKDCYRLSSVRFSCNLVSIESDVFNYCTALTTVIIPSGVERIGEGAFKSCAITHAAIPDTVTSIGPDAFGSSLLSINVDDNNPKYDSRGGCNAIIETATGTLIACCRNTVIPYGVRVVAQGISSGTVESLVFPDGLLIIKEEAFFNCPELKSVVIPDSVMIIEDRAFAYCDSLSSVTLGRNIIKIGKFSFYNLDHYNDYNKDCLPMIYVPTGMKAKYTRILHEDFADRIIEK